MHSPSENPGYDPEKVPLITKTQSRLKELANGFRRLQVGLPIKRRCQARPTLPTSPNEDNEAMYAQ